MATPTSRFFSRQVSIYRQDITGLAMTGLEVLHSDLPSSPLWPFDTDYETYELTKTFRNIYVIYVGGTLDVKIGDYVDVDDVKYEVSRVNNYSDFLELHLMAEVPV